jgi:hypothetical protein
MIVWKGCGCGHGLIEVLWLRKTTKRLNVDSWCPSQFSNKVPMKCKSAGLPLHNPADDE